LSPRPRSRDKVVPVSIGIPVSLMIRLDNELDWKQSRSKWVKSAILQKLEGSFDFSSINSKQLLGMLHYRKIITTELLTSLVRRVEETEEPQ
jgi:metal-responsive CopG/Arc/MetJ family transcriptional regulator